MSNGQPAQGFAQGHTNLFSHHRPFRATKITHFREAGHPQKLKEAVAEIRRQHKELDKQQDALVEHMVETSNPKVMAAHESKIAKLKEDKLLLTDKLSQNTKTKATLTEVTELLGNIPSSPCNINENGPPEARTTVS